MTYEDAIGAYDKIAAMGVDVQIYGPDAHADDYRVGVYDANQECWFWFQNILDLRDYYPV